MEKCWILISIILGVAYCVSSQSTNPGNESTGADWRSIVSQRWAGAPSWFKMADQFMSNWMSDSLTPNKTDTTPKGGFFATLMDGIVSFSNEIAQNYNKNGTKKVEKTKKNKTGSNWFRQWRSNNGPTTVEKNSTYTNWFTNWRNMF